MFSHCMVKKTCCFKLSKVATVTCTSSREHFFFFPEPLCLKENVLAPCALAAHYRGVTALVATGGLKAPLCFVISVAPPAASHTLAPPLLFQRF